MNVSTYDADLIARGLARLHNGRVIPVMRGGDPATDRPFPLIPEALDALSDDDLQAFVDDTAAAVLAVGAAPADFISDALTGADLYAAMEASVEALASARTMLAERDAASPDFAALAALAAEGDVLPPADPAPEADPPADEPPAADPPVADPPADAPPAPADPPADAPVTAAAVPAVRRRPARAPSAAPAPAPREQVTLVAAAGAADLPLGYEFGSELEIAQTMIRRRSQFGNIPEGVSGEKQTIARADWSGLYDDDRKLDRDEVRNEALIASVIDDKTIRAEMKRRKHLSDLDGDQVLTASGGLCAPVTPYYDLAMISQAIRPVRAGLPSFAADRGGIRYARPASLSAVTTGVGTVTAANDKLGGTFATKSCQTIDCPAFSETDVQAIFHCLQTGNLPSRTFPELLAQWNQLTLAAHARLAESALLTAIDAFSTQVTAASLGLGAVGALLGQILAAANAMRNRHRMDPEAVLRLMLPDWALDMLLSDVIRSQFQRFDSDEAKLTALLRSFDIEPSFYIDGANGRGQVFGTQAAGPLLSFPPTVVWYLFPEGSFVYLDGGTLELGLVRDHILNATNDFQLFGETFENVAFVGVESLAVASTVCDSGTVSLPNATECPINYVDNS